MTTTNRGFAKVAASSPDYEGATGGAWGALGATLDLLDAALGALAYAADGAIAIKEGTAAITKSTAAALTLAAPTAGLPSAGGDDGKVLRIIGTTAHAHTVTTPSNKINGNKLTATFANAGDAIVLVAYGGVWYTESNTTTLG